MTTKYNVEVGQKVEIIVPDGHVLYSTAWWPKKGVRVTGTVQKLFKNGKVAVAVDQLRNRSEDGKHTCHFGGKGSTINIIPVGRF